VIGPAVKAVPAVRYAVGVAGIMAALALGAAFFKDVASAVIGTVAMIILMVLLRVFAAMAATPNHQLKWPAIVLTWTVMVLFILGAGTIFSSVVFGKPRPLSELISGGGGRIDHTYSNTTVTGDQLPGSVKE
jgi:ABC-type polysaccharide/polyol phosphate export permease